MYANLSMSANVFVFVFFFKLYIYLIVWISMARYIKKQQNLIKFQILTCKHLQSIND